MKLFQVPAALIAASLMFSCADNNEPADPVIDPVETVGVYVLNQGNMYTNIAGSLTAVDLATQIVESDAFLKVNGRVLGDMPQDMLTHGGKIYIAVSESNIVEVIDRSTLRSIKTVSVGTPGNPRYLAAKDGYVYVSLFDGYIARLDTVTLELDKTLVKVGPNPEQIAIVGNYLYSANSDGLNWELGYGTTVSKVDLSTFTEEKQITVGTNPRYMVTNGVDLFVLCLGNYTAENPAVVKQIHSNDSVETLFEATRVAISGNRLFMASAPIYAPDSITYSVFDITTRRKSELKLDNIISPLAIAVHPSTEEIFVTTYSVANGWSDPCLLNEYTPTGSFIRSYPVGIGAECIRF